MPTSDQVIALNKRRGLLLNALWDDFVATGNDMAQVPRIVEATEGLSGSKTGTSQFW